MTEVGTVFDARGREYGWRDVLAAADAWGELAAVRRDAARSVASRRTAPPLAAADLRAAAHAWRRERRLLSGEELETWLEARELRLKDLRDFLAGRLLRDRAVVPAEAAPAAEVDAFLRVEILCSGIFDRWAHKLAARVAVVDDAGHIEELEGRYRSWVDGLLDPDALESELRRRGLDWTRISVTYAVFDRWSAAEEAVLCVRDDELTLAEVAAMADVEAHEDEWRLDELSPQLAARLLGAQPGEVVGPVAAESGDEVIVVHHKVAPTTDDLEIRALAVEAVTQRAVQRAIDAVVRWHDHP